MIEIICGVYGGKDGMKRPGDGAFSLPAAEEARLVARKVARYVDPPKQADTEIDLPGDDDVDAPIGFDETPPDDFVDDGEDLPELPEGVIGIPEYSENMKVSELREIGAMCGLTFKVGMTKAEMVAALDKHIEENMVDDEEIIDIDSEDAPSFDASEAVL